MSTAIRFLAFYLPQFHAIPENDAWWGPGFTEWTNVRRARPLFTGHQQPRVPGELGYYDLRDPDIRAKQAELAQSHGIDGFVYYHYWFNGRRLLHAPFDEVLASGKPDLPFCICWANEPWTRTWDGSTDEVLISQQYSEEDDRNHIRWMATAFQDRRYIRIDGRPVVIVYRAGHLPDPLRTTGIWREEAGRMGVGNPYLCRVENFPEERGDPAAIGFDAAVEFQPDWLRPGRPRQVSTLPSSDAPLPTMPVREYPLAVARAVAQRATPYRRFRCVSPGFDNTPRRPQTPVVYVGATPAMYSHFVRRVVAEFTPHSPEENLVFVNAWNEWGEGNYLEPDARWGRQFLEAHRTARYASLVEPAREMFSHEVVE